MAKPPIAFMSYVRLDDQHENGRLTQFRERLSGEVRMQTGEAFEIFQDRNDIEWGQQWRDRIEGALDSVTFLIPVITPAFLKSAACREELERFLKREASLGRKDLILPVYYVECPILSNEAKRKQDPLAEAIASRQYADWRELRFEPFSSPEVGRRLAMIAKQIVDALDRHQSAPIPSSRTETASSPVQAGALTGAPETVRGPQPKTKVPTIIVDSLHRGHFSTLTQALEAAKSGMRILVRPGLYREGVVIDKPVEIVGDGEKGDIVFEASGKDVILFRSTMGRIANLTLRQTGGGECFCIDISQGRLDLEECDISSQGLSCVAIHDGADPRVRHNRIHDGKDGVVVYANGQGTLEDNEIFGNAAAGVVIIIGSNPTLRRNRIYDSKQCGVLISMNGQGMLEDNEISGNAFAGVEIKEGGNPILRRNRIHGGTQTGVYVHANGKGTLEENEIFDHVSAGVYIAPDGSPTVRHNRIANNGYEGIWVAEGSAAIIEENDLRGNARGAWQIDAASESRVQRTGNSE